MTEADLRGDLHCHTTLSDGRSSLEDMARGAEARGYEYLAVTDHSASHGFGNDVQADELLQQVERVRELNERLDTLRVLAGSEVNINTDGSLDYEDDVLAELDWVVASVHTSFRMGEKAMTERMMAAMDHPLVDAIGHPTGRLILRREPYAIDVERVVGARGPDRHDARDQRQPEPAGPDRHPRAAGGGGRGDDRDRLRRPQRPHAGRDPVRHRHRTARVADKGQRREHAHLEAAGEAAQSGARAARRR